MENITFGLSQEEYNRFIETLNTKECYIIEKKKMYKIKPYYDFDSRYKITAVNIQDEDDYEYWYTDDLYDFVYEGYVLFFVEEKK